MTVAAAVALAVIVVTGGAVRVTGSGLGCPEWPTCTDERVIAPLEWHPMIEFVNRVFTGVVSVAVVLAVLGALLRSPRRRDLTLLSSTLVLGVIGQAGVGALSVYYELKPQWVMAHFMLSMVIIWAAVVLCHRAREPDARPQLVVHRQFLVLARSIAVLGAVVLFVGTIVTGTGPHGGDEHVERLSFDPHLVTKIHGTLVWILIALTVFVVWRLHAVQATSTLVRRGEVLAGLMVMQGAIGYLQYSLHVPALLVLAHIAGATAVWIGIVWFNLGFYERYDVTGMPVYDGDAYPQDFTALAGGQLSER